MTQQTRDTAKNAPLETRRHLHPLHPLMPGQLPNAPGLKPPDEVLPEWHLFFMVDAVDETIIVHSNGLPAVMTSIGARALAKKLESLAAVLDEVAR